MSYPNHIAKVRKKSENMPFCQLNNVNVSDILSHPDNLSVSARQPGINLTEIITGSRRRNSSPELQHNWIDPFIIPVQ